jgi:hypothetical protein
MEHKHEQILRDIKEIFEERPKLYRCPLARKMQRTTADPEPAGPVKVYSKREILLYEMRKRESSFNF